MSEEKTDVREVEIPVERAPLTLKSFLGEVSFKEWLRQLRHNLRQPRDSGEYKYAVQQLRRLWSPITGIVLPSLLILILLLMPSTSSTENAAFQVTVIETKEPPKLDDVKALDQDKPLEPPPPPEEMPEAAPNNNNDAPGPAGPPGPNVAGEAEALFTPKPAAFDSVAMVKSPIVMKGIYASRTPGARGAALRQYGGGGGGGGSEGVVYLALRWLKKYQEADGSWLTSSGGDKTDSRGASAPAMTGLALLAYLGHGETPASEEFGHTVEKAIKWLVDNQSPDGRFQGSDGNNYSLPIAAYALCEAYTLTKIPALKDAATKSIDVIVKGQNASFLWNYNCAPAADRNDMSYSGWCMQALKAASSAGLENPELKECMAKAVEGCKLSYAAGGGGTGGGFCYARTGKTPGGISPGLTAVGVLCMQLLGAGQAPAARGALSYLDGVATCNWAAPWGGNPIYYWYYATQAKFHAGGAIWKAWNAQFNNALSRNITVIPKAIEDTHGKLVDIGYWKPAAPGEHCQSFVYNTTLCALMLEVYYRYLPTYKPPEETAAEAQFTDKDKDIKVDIR